MGKKGAILVAIAAGACGTVAPERELRIHEVSEAVRVSCRANAEILCRRVTECAPDYVRFWFGSLRDCLEATATYCAQQYEGPGGSEVAFVCTSAAVVPCEVFANPLRPLWRSVPEMLMEACALTPGARAIGDRCLRNGDCVSGRCTLPYELPRFDECGVCIPAARPGDPCKQYPGCGALLPCIEDRCVAPREDGLACSSPYECLGTCRDGTCVPKGGAGAPCQDVHDCDLAHRLACGDDRRCGEVFVNRRGETCSGSELPVAGFVYCDATALCREKVCMPRGLLGEACVSKSDCRGGYECTEGTCALEPPSGSRARSCRL